MESTGRCSKSGEWPRGHPAGMSPSGFCLQAVFGEKGRPTAALATTRNSMRPCPSSKPRDPSIRRSHVQGEERPVAEVLPCALDPAWSTNMEPRISPRPRTTSASGRAANRRSEDAARQQLAAGEVARAGWLSAAKASLQGLFTSRCQRERQARGCTFVRREPQRHDRGRWPHGPIPCKPRRRVAGRCQARSRRRRGCDQRRGRTYGPFRFRSVDRRRQSILEVVAETVDVTSEGVAALFSRHDNIRYLQHTAGISPRPLTPPEELQGRHARRLRGEPLGRLQMLKQGIHAGARAAHPRCHHPLDICLPSAGGPRERRLRGVQGRSPQPPDPASPLLPRSARPRPERPRTLTAARPHGRAERDRRGTPASGGGQHAHRRPDRPTHIAAATMYFWSNECGAWAKY